MPEPYKTTAVWTEDSLPAAIRAAHLSAVLSFAVTTLAQTARTSITA